MMVPEEFNKLCSYFIQDMHLVGSTPEEWIAFALRHVDKKKQIAVKLFLVELLSKNTDSTELQRIWFGTGADIYFPDGEQLRGFLTQMRDMIKESR